MKLSTRKPFDIWRRLFNKGAQLQSNWIQPNGFDTDITVYSPINKCKVPLITKKKGIVGWYMCGPTVFREAAQKLGRPRTFVVFNGHPDFCAASQEATYVRFDIIRRILSNFFDINVISVMGITDIDDKIIKRASDTREEWRHLTKRYEQEFIKEMTLLNVLPPYLYCRVTDYIPQIVQFVETIFATGTAYIGKDGSVYFDTMGYHKYGKLQKAQSSEGHSIKRSTTDFALWKASKPGEPFWESPWGPGRPGWHIECSAMASAALGNTIDIHSGGIDLLFPHHENEEAQSCCHHRVEQWVNYWLHSGHLYLTGDEKMSKSLKNTISIQEMLEKYSANEFRLFCLLTHYRTGIEFSHEKMQSAVKILSKLEYFLSDCRNYVSGKLNVGNVDETFVSRALQVANEKVRAALANDFDTTTTIFAIQELAAAVNKEFKEAEGAKGTVRNRDTSHIAAVAEYVRKTLSALGIFETESIQQNEHQWTDIVDSFVSFRQTVRNRALDAKDERLLQACDQARDKLSACGIKVKDYKNVSTWTLTKSQNSVNCN